MRPLFSFIFCGVRAVSFVRRSFFAKKRRTLAEEKGKSPKGKVLKEMGLSWPELAGQTDLALSFSPSRCAEHSVRRSSQSPPPPKATSKVTLSRTALPLSSRQSHPAAPQSLMHCAVSQVTATCSNIDSAPVSSANVSQPTA